MSDTITPATGELFKALAKLQAELPEVGKGNTANTGTYSYKYADLADVSAAVMPLLGRLGLAFTSKPTLLNGQFVLAYSLVHESGEREDGVYPLQSNGTPQQMGSAITYARRYCLCAVTGVAPAEDDDDAAEAQRASRQSAGGAFGNAAPSRPRQDGNGQQQRREPKPAAAQAPAVAAIDPEAQPFADEVHNARTPAEIEDAHRRACEAGKLTALIRNPASGRTGNLALYLDWRRKHLTAAVRLSPEDPWAQKVADLAGLAEADAALDEIAELVVSGIMHAERGHQVEGAIRARFPEAGRPAEPEQAA